ncbi:nuclease [Sphingomonas sp. PL-96]|uniref:nuclease n=1 Tax=Sphingomonas sp. PL-96 TaxID=2887201 RepID=UPI001E54D40B|nr:nuclease [Sphingomonas sp. PL-96]MCC2977049.1 nuclease [Sphingomonas sp. PL-96]
MRTALLLGMALLLAAQPTAALAWGGRGHAVIDQAALAALPEDGPVFLRNHAEFIAEEAGAPDTWRSSSEPFSKIDEDPNHTWFVERLAFLREVPRSRYAFVLALYREHERVRKTDPKAAERLNVRWTGTLPYAVMEGYGRIVAGMRSLRSKQSKGEPTANIERTLAFYTAWMSHYIADAANPHHVSIHCEGWVGDNPKGYATGGGIHGKFEIGYADAINLQPSDFSGRIGAPQRQDGDLFDAVLAYLKDSNREVETIFDLDKRGVLADPASREGRDFVYRRSAAGAAMLRDLLTRAWKESATPGVGVARPQDPSSPNYDPETGTAPAP